jgi:hypothetical protein
MVGTPFVPTPPAGRGAQERSRDETACGARRRASLDRSEHRGSPQLNQTVLGSKWGNFSRHFWEDSERR